MMNRYQILRNTLIKPDIYEMVVKKNAQEKVLPGMFYNVTVPHEGLMLKRPISVCDATEDTFTLTYKVFGQGTRLISTLEATYIELMGPLGTPLPLIIEQHTVLLIGAGIGITPLVYLAKELTRIKKKLIILLAAKTAEGILYSDTFEALGQVHLMTEDGSTGFQGNPIQYLKETPLDFDYIYACGPEKLLQAVDETYKTSKQGSLLLEERMACGFGLCMGCVKKTIDGYIRVCKEGPSINLGVIVYEPQS
jgi:dihydroorotate dehydrogenase electron transfer subunit